jgi:hypothetical protein
LDGEDDEIVGLKRLWLVKLANDVTYKRFVPLLCGLRSNVWGGC